jgi:eukaryotic-like serine/threonine-protein kinase
MKPGDIIDGRFELERSAGSGGMGEVFRARDRESGEVVAVKVLLDPEAPEAARFSREATVLAELSHPGIVRYVAHGVTGSGELYLAMEWLEGEDLLSRLIRTGLTLKESVQLGARVATALGAAHARNIIHRDLKPTNLFLVNREIEQVKLLDFGIAHVASGTRMTRTGVLLGTPGYMAPEQARSSQGLDARADVFSLGCVLFECLTGKPAFSGDRFIAVLAKVLFEEPPRVSELRPRIPADLDALVARMLAKAPDDRLRDGAAVAAALTAVSTDEALDQASPRVPALTSGERRALSAVLIGAGTPAPSTPMELFSKTSTSLATEALHLEAAACGGHLEHLADGSVVVTIAGGKMATDQAAQAARCALALRKHAKGRPMALSTGRGELTGRMPVGDAIDRAATLLTKRTAPPPGAGGETPEPIAIDEVTAGLLDARFDVRESDAGLSLYGERDLAEGARTLLGKATSCVGRTFELTTLERFFDDCIDEPISRVVLVSARAGIGKSRVAHELLRNIQKRRGDEVSIWIARADSLRAGSAFGLLGQALRGACGLRDGEPLEERRSKLLARVAEHVSADKARRVAEFLGEIMGTPLPDEDSVPLRAARKDAQLMGEQMRAAWEEFLAAETSVRPVLLLLEDLHWGDLPTVRFIDGALRNLRDKPWMVLALARPEVHDMFPKLWADREMQEIRLKELPRKASERLVRQVLGNGLSAETVERLVARSDGNAFYLEELIRATAERRGDALPETVLAMVQSRLEGLDGNARRVLRAASVFGEVFWPGGAAALLGDAMGPAEVSAILANLVDQEVLVRRLDHRLLGEQEMMFRHALLREGAYEMLTEQDRILGHRLAGEWLLGRGEGDPMVLAEHFERGKDPARAGSFYLRAAEQAHRGGDADAAIARAKRGIKGGVPEELRVALLGLLCEIHVWSLEREYINAVPYAEEVMSLATPGSVPWASAVAVKMLAVTLLGKTDELQPIIRLLQRVEPSPGAVGTLAYGLTASVFGLDLRGRFDLSEILLRRQDEVVRPFADSDPLAWGWMNLVHARRESFAKEDPWMGLARAEAAQTSLRRANYQRGAFLAQVYVGMNLSFLGRYARAERELSTIPIPDEEFGSAASVRPLFHVWVQENQGALPEAETSANSLIEFGSKRRSAMVEGRGRWALSGLLLRKGALDEAEREVRAALEVLKILPPEHSAATATLAAILLAQGRAPLALTAAEEAMAKYDALHACAFFRGAYLRLIHAECLEAKGDHVAACNAIATARERLFANAAKVEDPEYKKSFLTSVPENARTLSLAQLWVDEATPLPR